MLPNSINDIKQEKYDWASSLNEPERTAWLDFYERFFAYEEECNALYQQIIDGKIVRNMHYFSLASSNDPVIY
jgi:hypothetical protein